MAKVYVGSARSDENGKANSGKAGDQKNGREVSTQSWYKHSKGWRTLRAKDPAAREKIAWAMEAACDNQNIGYDQWQRDTLLKQAVKYDYDISKVNTPCETDCSALTRVCCAYAFGRDIVAETTSNRFSTRNLMTVLLKTGLFEELTGDKYNTQSDYLMRGDIQCTKTQGHVVVVISDGDKAEKEEVTVEPEKPVESIKFKYLRRGMFNDADVEAMQEKLMKLGYDLGADGADGDFGKQTERALKSFQTANDLEVDGVYGPLSDAALLKAIKAFEVSHYVTIEGGNCFIRTGPGTMYDDIGVAYRGEKHPYGGQTASNGWHLIEYKNQNAWVSGKYGKLEKA